MVSQLLHDGRTPELTKPTYNLISTIINKQGFYTTLYQVCASRQRAS